ncbi:MAG TPA: metallophosphoesterase [Tepidisphaeraceae bacterium]|nr:metallophosphoesterase [Tepidisphaeraceae bacterium]
MNAHDPNPSTALCTCEPLESRRLLSSVRFAVIGDFGSGETPEADVAQQIQTWDPDLILTVGDNNYPSGSQATIDAHLGQYYHQYIYPYRGEYGDGSPDATNHFVPPLGNHDWYTAGAKPYLNYFALPGNERYYTFTVGPVQFFAVDSDPNEPDLYYVNDEDSTEDSPQGQWLQQALAESTAPWKIVYFHHAPYSSGTVHGPSAWMQWPFKAWGATAVLAGHEHHYERLSIDGLPYFVDGSGGDDLYKFGDPAPGSQVRYNGDFGAMLVTASDSDIVFQFITRTGKTIDTYAINADSSLPSPWVSSDVGPVLRPGSATYASGRFTLQGSGQDIWKTRDAFQFTYQTLTGNGQIIARVRSIEPTNPWAKAGVMIRQNLRADSPNAAMLLTPAGDALFQKRATRQARTTARSIPDITAPYWVKLVRTGNQFAGYVSQLGKRWTLVGQATLDMSDNVYVGLAVTARKRTRLNTAVFDKVRIAAAPAPLPILATSSRKAFPSPLRASPQSPVYAPLFATALLSQDSKSPLH